MKSIPHAPPEPNAFAAGAEACKKGKDVHTANPYVKGSRPYIRWINGYQVIPGSLDNGATDTEYTVHPERIICAAEEQFATHAELDAAVSDVCDVQDELEARIKDLEALHADLYTHVHSRPHWLTPPNVTEWLAQHNPPFAAAAHVPEADYAHIPAAKWEALCAELEALRHPTLNTGGDYVPVPAAKWKFICDEREALRAFKAGVPWDVLDWCIDAACQNSDDAPTNFIDVALTWLYNYAPKEATE